MMKKMFIMVMVMIMAMTTGINRMNVNAMTIESHIVVDSSTLVINYYAKLSDGQPTSRIVVDYNGELDSSFTYDELDGENLARKTDYYYYYDVNGNMLGYIRKDYTVKYHIEW